MQSQPVNPIKYRLSWNGIARIERFVSFQIFKELIHRLKRCICESSKLYRNFELLQIYRKNAVYRVVEANGIEPMTSCLQSTRSPN